MLSQTAGASTPLCLPFGVPMALVLARDGRSAVLMSHDLLDVLTLADRVLVLDERAAGAPGLGPDITADSAAELRLAPGDRVYFSVKAQEVTVHLSR